jgi:thiamine-phosphate pyrophosphorylase
MKPPLPTPSLMVITNRHLSADLPATVICALEGGAKWILLREKDMAPRPRLDLARRLKADADRHGALFGVNSDVAAAQAIGTSNVHLPADTLDCEIYAAHVLLGASVHDTAEAEVALRAGADYLLLAPIFETRSKVRPRPPLGLARLQAIAKSVRVPVIALGGIDPERAAACLDAGAAGVAVMGAIMRAGDPALVVQTFLEAMSR